MSACNLLRTRRSSRNHVDECVKAFDTLEMNRDKLALLNDIQEALHQKSPQTSIFEDSGLQQATNRSGSQWPSRTSRPVDEPF